MRYAQAFEEATPSFVVMAIARESARQRAGTVPGKEAPLAVMRSVARVLRFGDWREQLGQQLAHPERLLDDHRLRCEVTLAQCKEPRPGFQPVDSEVARKLGLPPLPAQFVLRVVEDPTRAPAPPARRALIPEKYRRPWEFQVSRQEAILQMTNDERPGWRQRLTRFLQRREAERATDRWRGQLEGKPLPEQLWGVRPPRGALRCPEVRSWVESALASAGWDPVRGRREWEIYWRRKGV